VYRVVGVWEGELLLSDCEFWSGFLVVVVAFLGKIVLAERAGESG